MIVLSEEQQAAVETESVQALVLAGAGSGKTRVLTERIAHLIENRKVSPYEILSFTFTRKSAGEMRKRLEDRIGADAHKITMGTMHGVALNYLQRFGEMIGLRPGKITVYSSWEETYLLKDVAMELGYHTGRAWKGVKKKEVDSVFYDYYTRLFYPANGEKPEHEILRAFLDRCRENNALTYGTILTAFYALLPKIFNFLNIRHIMIDEVQDNDPLQWNTVNQFCKLCNASLFAVGDLDQSIYSFRGADPEYLIRHTHEFDVYRLQTNYRSAPEIVEGANRLIEHNQNRLEKTMEAVKFDGNIPDNPVHFTNFDSTMIAENLVNMPAGPNTALLARNHFLLEKVSRLLDESGFNHEYVGKATALTNSEEFRRFHAFLKLIVNPFDNFSFLLIRDIIGISLEEFGRIRVAAAHAGKSHFQVWMDSDTNDPATWPKWFNESIAVSNDVNSVYFNMNDIEIFNFEDENIIEFFYAWIVDGENHLQSLQAYLDWLSTFDIQDEIKDDTEYLQLMTIHASKGLEWPTVIIAGLNEGIFPSKHALRNLDEMEGERRLAYVAFTRAEDQLILTSRPLEKDSEMKVKNPVSRFVGEAVEGKSVRMGAA